MKYQRWTSDQDLILKNYIQSYKSVKEGCAIASKHLDRTPAACASRYSKKIKPIYEKIAQSKSKPKRSFFYKLFHWFSK